MKILKYIFFVLTALCMLLSGSVYGQGARVIKGTVTDKSDGEPLIAANVMIVNANGRMITGRVTDLDGNFAIEVTEANAILRISYIGYKPIDTPIGSQSEFKVALEPESTALEEVSVTGQRVEKVDDGYSQIEKRNLATATTTVKLAEVARSSATSVAEMMQGRAAGVQITATSGDPGAAYTIRIRGNSSINASNDPLVVIDNVQTELSVKGVNLTDLMSAHSPLANLNPEDIESIDILKDAASTAIYGSRGANGVVVITTKRGRKNETSISYGANLSVQFSPKEVPILSGDDQKILILEGEQNRGVVGVNATGSGNVSQYLGALRDDPNRDDYYYYNNNTDWVSKVQQTGYTLKNDFSLRGGGNTTRYNFSVSHTNQTGTTKGGGLNRLTGLFNLDYQISNKLMFKSSITYTRTTQIQDGNVSGSSGSPLSMARAYPAFLPVYQKDEFGNDLPDYYIPEPEKQNFLFPRNMYNPVAWTNLTRRESSSENFRSVIQVIYDVIPDLRFTSRVSVSFNNGNDHQFVPASATNRLWNDAMINRTQYNNNNSQDVQQENVLSYSKVFNEIHQVSLMAVSKLGWSRSYSMAQTATNTANSNIENTGTTNRWSALSAGEDKDASVTFVGQFHYMLLDRYILQLNTNTEGSSRFGASNRWATFPTFALAWRVSGEPFMEKLPFVDELKLRYSLGKAGNSPGQKYLHFNTYSAGSVYLDQTGVNSNNIQLNTLKWETSTTNNLGLDGAFFNNRLTVTADVYERKTEDLLLNRDMPGTSGFSSYLTNFGNLRNRGVEFDANVRIIEKAFRWSMNFNIASNANKITYLPEDRGYVGRSINGYQAQIRQGDPIGSFYGYKFVGIYATDEDAVARDAQGNKVFDLDGKPKRMQMGGRSLQGGDAQYEDLNYDAQINNQDITIIGDSNPNFFGGLGSSFAYKSWKLDFFWQYQVGNDVLNISRKNLEAMSGGANNNNNQAQSVMRRWRKQGDITDIPRVTFNTNSNNAGSDRFVEDGSYIRMKSITLRYDVPSAFCKKVGIRSANMFVTGYNLMTLTDYTGQDPEISIGGSDPWAVGMDNGRTAVPKSFTFGLSITFN